jgi:hypothetical protein
MTQYESEEDAIICVIAHRSHCLEEEFINFTGSPNLMADFQASFPGYLPPESHTLSLGNLDILPLELQSLIVRELDIEAALNCCRVNRQARRLVLREKEFNVVTSQASTCLLALVKTGLARYFSVCDIYRTMFQPNCEICGKPTETVYLLTNSRVCAGCTNHSTVEIATKSSVDPIATRNPVDPVAIANLVVAKCQPNMYLDGSQTRDFCRHAIEVVNVDAYEKMARDTGRIFTCERGRLVQGYYDVFDRLVVPDMVVAPLIILDDATEEAVELMGCRGCLENGQRLSSVDLWARYGRNFTRDMLLDHYKECPWAQELWLKSPEGMAEH